MLGFFVKQLPLVPLDILRNNFDFITIIDQLFGFNGDSLSYSLPWSLDSLVY